jgi:hypothetical protein
VRSQYSGRLFVASWPRSATLTLPVWTVVRLVERVPRTPSRKAQFESVSIAEPMPTKPPPFLK